MLFVALLVLSVFYNEKNTKEGSVSVSMFIKTKISKEKQSEEWQKRLFGVLVLTGCVANCLGFFINAILFGITLPTIVCGVCEIMVTIFGVIGLLANRYKIASILIILLLVMFELPFLIYIY